MTKYLDWFPNEVNADSKTDDYIALRYWHLYISGEGEKFHPNYNFLKINYKKFLTKNLRITYTHTVAIPRKARISFSGKTEKLSFDRHS